MLADKLIDRLEFMKKSLIFWLISVVLVFSVQAQNKRKVSLLVTYCDKGESLCNVQHLERFDFINGELVSRKIVVSLNQDVNGFVNRVIDNRYLLTAPQGKIFDLYRGKFIIGLPDQLKGERKALLPGLISPDEKKSVDRAKFGSVDKLEIHFVDKPKVIVKGSFQVSAPENACYMPSLPLVWIDNERILTQTSNGNLVIVSLDGTISPFLQLPCTDSAALRRNKSNKIIYECNGDEYFIDVDNRRFEKIKRDLGNGFALDFVGSKDVYYYNNEEIGRDGWDAVAIKSYLAMLYGESKDGIIDSATVKTIKVWNAIKKDWISLTVDGWGAKIIGWIEE